MSALERRALHCCVSLGALVPVVAGLGGGICGADLLGEASSPNGESHVRYLSGLLLAIGLGFWSTVPEIERKTMVFQLLSSIVFVGGIFRAAHLLSSAVPTWVMYGAAIMELFVTPLLCLWQSRVAKSV